MDIINQHNLKSMGGSQVSAASVAASPTAAAAPAAAISTGGSTGAAGNYATDVASSSQTSIASPSAGAHPAPRLLSASQSFRVAEHHAPALCIAHQEMLCG